MLYFGGEARGSAEENTPGVTATWLRRALLVRDVAGTNTKRRFEAYPSTFLITRKALTDVDTSYSRRLRLGHSGVPTSL